jgi:diguanylate cyclase (GGDEF)-like protein
VVGTYDLKLVALSLVVAAIASYTALDLAGRVTATRGRASLIWLVAGAGAMGTGIWSMHFIGMLAFSLPAMRLAYDLPITLASMLAAIVVSGLALYVVRRPALTASNLTAGATLMGVGICVMHYTGMAAMRMSPPIEYDPPLFIASVLIAIVASLAALWIAFQLRQKYSALAIAGKLGSAVVMGLAITGMHYTGMAAAQFAPGSVCLAADAVGGGMDTMSLAVSIGIVTILILAVTLSISALDAHFAARNARLAVELQGANEQLRSIALYDTLTGLPNRFLLEDRLRQAALYADRNRTSFSLMFVDLDDFKPVNDTYGHAAGDELLKQVGRRLQECRRRHDTVARTGGDEFVIVLGDVGDTQGASVIGEKILEELAKPILVAGNMLEISCSIGISMYPTDGKDIATLTANADVAMYHAKKSGKHAFRLFAPDMRPNGPAAATG